MIELIQKRIVMLALLMMVQCAPAFALMVAPPAEKSDEVYQELVGRRRDATRDAELIRSESQNNSKNQELLRLQNLPQKPVSEEMPTPPSNAAVLEAQVDSYGSYAFITLAGLAALGLAGMIIYSRHTYKNRKLLVRNR